MTLLELGRWVLEAQGGFLSAAVDALGAAEAMECVDRVDELDETAFRPAVGQWALKPGARPPVTYDDLDTLVQAMELPPRLEDSLWAFPPYRALVEAAGNPAEISIEDEQPINDLVHAAQRWFESLMAAVDPTLAPALAGLHESAWKRFQHGTLRRIGKNPLQLFRQKG